MLINVREAFVSSVLGFAVSLSLLGWGSALAADVPAKPADAVVNSKSEESYSVTMNNLGEKDLRLERGYVVCMNNSGPVKFFVWKNQPTSFTLADSNFIFSDCTDATKQVSWKVYKENSGDQVNLITFIHNKYNGRWLTRITDLNNSIDATCDGVSCANTGTTGVPYGGPIVINIHDQ